MQLKPDKLSPVALGPGITQLNSTGPKGVEGTVSGLCWDSFHPTCPLQELFSPGPLAVPSNPLKESPTLDQALLVSLAASYHFILEFSG